MLAQPQQLVQISAEEEAARADWAYNYAQRRKAAASDKLPVPIEMPDFAPYAAWGNRIIEDWRLAVDRFADGQRLNEEQRQQAEEIFTSRHQQLADYLASESDAIADYRHQLWRLEELQQSPTAGAVPYQDERIAVKSLEVAGQHRKWTAQVDAFETHLHHDLRGLLTDQQKAEHQSQNSPSLEVDPAERRLAYLNLAVTCVTVGVGVCLLLGFFTRLASLVGLLFLLSVMASQPPWQTVSDPRFA